MSAKAARKAARKVARLERRFRDQGYEIVDGGDVLDAPDDALVSFYLAAKAQHGRHGRKGLQRMFAAELVRRGALHGCGCADCTEAYADAQAWEAVCARMGVDPRSGNQPR